MTTDDLGQNDPSGLQVRRDGEQPQDTLQGGQPELDAYGVPVHDRAAKNRVYLGATASSVCAVISACLAIVARTSHHYYNLPAWQVWLGAGTGLVAAFLATATLKRAEKEKQQLGVAGRSILRAIAIVGFLGFIIMMGDLQGPDCAAC